ncbi:hypothetical protein D3C83_202800 [compost metagenome]
MPNLKEPSISARAFFCSAVSFAAFAGAGFFAFFFFFFPASATESSATDAAVTRPPAPRASASR